MRFVLHFQDIGQNQVSLVGGKAANLAELSRIEGTSVPAGFCVTTEAFQRAISADAALPKLFAKLSRVKAEERDAIAKLSADIRRAIESLPMPPELVDEVRDAIGTLGASGAYAVRSSATAEDSPTASFAGQQDSYLNVKGADSVLKHVSRCWASLFTDRAVSYRLHQRIDHAKVHMAVVVQRMIAPLSSGVLFTADPLTGNRKVASVEGTWGLAENLVSGLVNADVFKVKDGVVISSQQQDKYPTLSEPQLLRLVELGRRVEAHFGRPQDIEWCLEADTFHLVQARPITTLFPIPEASGPENRVYLSTAHQQMMTDAMTPLGISMWQMYAAATMVEAGGRLWVEITRQLSSPAMRAGMLAMMGRADPLFRDAIETVLERNFIPLVPDAAPAAPPPPAVKPPDPDPAVIPELMASAYAGIDTVKRDIAGKTGPELLEFIQSDIPELKKVLRNPRSTIALMAGMEATWWLNEKLAEWLGETNAADVLTQSVPNNVTSEMGLALLDVADVIRPHQEVVKFLEDAKDDRFLDGLAAIPGGSEARDAIQGWLAKYGMRGSGEIDISRPRWMERPSMLLPAILGNVRNAEPGAAARRFEQGRKDAEAKEKDVLQRLRALPDGDAKAQETKRMIDRLRAFIGYREFPKFALISRAFLYKQALVEEARRLVREGVFHDEEDMFFLTFPELQDVVRTRKVDANLLRERRETFRVNQGLKPPRVLTSEGEGLWGSAKRGELPPGVLPGVAVSSGSVEGRARIILDMARANLETGDILVTAFTDPSWTPLFVGIAGLVTEVGGLMTHGAVIAREYGLPAVVGVDQATRKIQDGQRIRVDGTRGFVEILR